MGKPRKGLGQEGFMVEKSKNKGPELGMTWTLQVRKKGNAFEALREGRVDEDDDVQEVRSLKLSRAVRFE